MGLPERTVLECRSALVVTDPGERDTDGWEDLRKRLTTTKPRVGGDGEQHWYDDIVGYLWDHTADGKRVLRLPAETDPDLLARAFPYHRRMVVAGHWDARPVSVGFRHEDFPPRNRTQERIAAFLAREGDWRGNPDVGTDLVVAGTDAGKTYCALAHWDRMGVVLGGCFAASMHLENFKKDILKFTGVPEERIATVEGVDKMERYAANADRYDAFLIMLPTIESSLSKDLDGEVIQHSPTVAGEAIRSMGIGLMVYDECHLALKALLYTSMILNVRSSVYLTATPSRTDSGEARLLKQQIPADRAFWAPREPRLLVTVRSFNSKPEAGEEKGMTDARTGYFKVYEYYNWLLRRRREFFLAMILDEFERAFEGGAKHVALVLACDLKVMGEVNEAMHRAMPGRTIGDYTSRVDKKVRMRELEREVILTTEKSFGASINPVIDVMILCAPLASRVNIEQITGRLRGSNGGDCRLVDLYDRGFTKTIDQMRTRRGLYRNKLAKGEVLEEEGLHVFG